MKKKSKELAIHDKDTGSSEVQIAQLTDKIENLSNHIKQYKKDKHSSVGLLRAVNRSCLLYTSPSPRDVEESRMPSSA